MQTNTIDINTLGTIYLTGPDVAARAGITPGSLRRLRCQGKGPQHAGTMNGAGGSRPIFNLADVQTWLERRAS